MYEVNESESMLCADMIAMSEESCHYIIISLYAFKAVVFQFIAKKIISGYTNR